MFGHLKKYLFLFSSNPGALFLIWVLGSEFGVFVTALGAQ